MNEHDRLPTTGDLPDKRMALRLFMLTIGVLLSSALLYLTFASVSWGPILEALGRAQPQWLALCVTALLANYGLKVGRTWLMLRIVCAPATYWSAAVPFMGAMALNNILPLRAGDLFRVIATQRLVGIPRAAQINALAMERLLDVLVLTSLLFFTIQFVEITLPKAFTGGVAILAGVAVILVMSLFFAPGATIRLVSDMEARLPRVARICSFIIEIARGIRELSKPGRLIALVSLSYLAWSLEGLAFYYAIQSLGVSLPLHGALFALAIGTLVTLVPSAPGYIGTFHFFVAMAISAFGIDQVLSTAAATLIHTILWLATTLIGLLLLWIAGLRIPLNHTDRPSI